MYKIAVDAMGGDNAPFEIIKGAVAAVSVIDGDIILVGKKAEVEKILNGFDQSGQIKVIDAPDVITNHDAPVSAIKRKKESSMAIGLKMLKSGEVDAFLSAGNTGAFMAGSLLLVGRIKGIDRPALGSVIPTINGKSLLLDMGANLDSKPINLVQWALMGKIYCEKVLDIHNPRVGIINVGKEESKGNAVVKEVYKTLSLNLDINFVGNIEAREILNGEADVIVCDGFIGNVIIKTIEGVAITLFDILKDEVKSSFKNKIGGLLLKQSLKNIKNRLDYSEYGGAPFLGIDGLCIKCHGSSKAKAVKNAITKAFDFCKKDVLSNIKDATCDKGEIL
jgi:glycerol-3-phosphate acyltransferase PlsX